MSTQSQGHASSRHSLTAPFAGVLLFTSIAMAAGCATVPPRPDDMARPPDEAGQVDFSALFGRSFGSNTVIVSSREPGLMRRVMVSPNVMFESSRSSVPEPDTVGPASPPPTAPDQRNALGTPISIADSSSLLRYLVDHRSTVIAPAVTRVWCGAEANCTAASWVERVLLMARAAPESTTPDTAGADENRFSLPTALMAVRALGSSNFELPIVVEDVERGRFRVRLAQYSGEPTQCPGLRLAVPYVAFSGEVVSASSGQVIARVDEVRAIATQVQLTRRVTVRSWQPVERQVTYGQITYTFTGDWSPVPLLCDSVQRQYTAIRRETGDAADTSSTVIELIRSSLDPLYRNESGDRPSRRAPVVSDTPPASAPAATPASTDASDDRRRRRHR